MNGNGKAMLHDANIQRVKQQWRVTGRGMNRQGRNQWSVLGIKADRNDSP